MLYRVNDSPVVLLYGSTPAYRTLSAGATGPDVAELNADLVALGYATRAQLSPTSASFGSATTTAVEKLQAALGVTQTGTLTLGQAVFEPTAVRVTSVSAQLGGRAQPGADGAAGHLDHSPGAGGVGRLATDRRGGRGQGDASPCPTTRPPRVSSPRWGRSPPAHRAPGSGGSGSSSAAPGTDTCSSGSSGSSTPTITVDVTPSDPAATGTWDQAPVQVGITTASVPNALVVPVTALLAQSGGGYAVEVVGAGGDQPSRAGLARTVRRRRRAGAGHRLGAGRRPRSGGPGHMTHTPPPTPRQHRGRGRQPLRDRRVHGCRCSTSTT